MIKLEKMSVKFPELDLIADWRNETISALRSPNLTAKGESQRAWVEGFTDKERYYFIYAKEENWTRFDLIGYCGLDKIDPVNRTAEISLLISPNERRMGYGTEAVKELLRMGFQNFNLNLIYAEVIDFTGAHLFWGKQGFKEEGRLRKRHYKATEYRDSFVLSITREEWEKGK